jgi:hypothetical protein
LLLIFKAGNWTQTALPNVDGRLGGFRGCLVPSKTGDLFFILPRNDTDGTLEILKATKDGGYHDYERIWRKGGFVSEVLVDPVRLDVDGVLSLFAVRKEGGEREVVVVDQKVYQ